MSDLTAAEWLRVKQKETGTEFSILRATHDFAPDNYEVLDKPATDTGNNPLPPKHKTSASKEAAKKATTGRQADTDKEKN